MRSSDCSTQEARAIVKEAGSDETKLEELIAQALDKAFKEGHDACRTARLLSAAVRAR